jgi:hypothetical protein
MNGLRDPLRPCLALGCAFLFQASIAAAQGPESPAAPAAPVASPATVTPLAPATSATVSGPSESPRPYVAPLYARSTTVTPVVLRLGDTWSRVTLERVGGTASISLGALLGATGVLSIVGNPPCSSSDHSCLPGAHEAGIYVGLGLFACSAAALVAGVFELRSASKMADRLRAANVSVAPWHHDHADGLGFSATF